MYSKIKQFIFLISLLPIICFAQNQARNWFFGNNAGLSFAGGSPTLVTGGALSNSLGCAAISGTNGNLLFYTDGVTVYTSSNAVMANGTGLHGINAPQPAIIIKQPSNQNIYYLFTVGGYSTSYGLKYSIVDMSLAAGAGSVITKNVLIDATCRDNITAGKHCNGDDIWVVSTNTFYPTQGFTSALLTPTGIGAVVSSSLNVAQTINRLGQLKMSPNSKKIGFNGFFNYFPVLGNTYQLKADFNNSTGIISNSTFNLQNGYNMQTFYSHGCEFSPNSRYFYYTLSYNAILKEDLCGINNTDFVYTSESSTAIDFGGNKRQFQLAPDGKIYVATTGSNSLGAINNTNNNGGLSTYTSVGVSIGSLTCQWGLPNFPGYYFEQKPTPFFTYTAGSNCREASFSTPSICTSYGYSLTGYQWNFGDVITGTNNISFLSSPTHTFSNPGNYNVTLIRYFLCNTNDTITQIINVTSPTISVSSSTLGCSIAHASVQVSGGSGSYTYQWNYNNIITNTISLNTSTTLAVNVIDVGAGNCMMNGTINITVPSFSVTVNTAPNLLCYGANNATVTANVNGGSGVYSYSWTQNSSTNSVANGFSSGNYTVFVHDVLHNCTYNKYFYVSQVSNPILVQTSVNNNSVCEGDSIGLSGIASGGLGNYNYHWLPTNTFSNQITCNLPAGNYVYTLQVLDSLNCSASNIVAFYVAPNPTLSISQITICANTVNTITVSGANSYTWQPGNIQTATLAVGNNSNTSFTVTGKNQFNCVSTQSTQIYLYPVVIANASNNSPVCESQSASFFASVSNAYLWKGPNNFFSATANPQLLNVQPFSSGVYTLVITDANGCKDSTQINLVVNPKPPVWINSNTSLFCIGQNVILTGIGANAYVWFNGSNNNPISYSPTSNTIVSIVGTDTLTGCTANATLQINVKECNGVGLNERDAFTNQIHIYPNPNQGYFTIDCEQSFNYVLINALGDKIIEGQLIQGANALQLNNLAKGIYILQCNTNGRSAFKKLVIE